MIQWIVLALSLLVTTGSKAEGLSPSDQARVERAFAAAQASEVQALLHRQELSRADFDRSQRDQFLSFAKKQGDEAREFFAQNRDPRARFEFQRDQKVRVDAFHTAQRTAREERDAQQKKQLESLRAKQASHRGMAESAWKAGKKPDANLWPEPGL